jgi:hypothetical protein
VLAALFRGRPGDFLLVAVPSIAEVSADGSVEEAGLRLGMASSGEMATGNKKNGHTSLRTFGEQGVAVGYGPRLFQTGMIVP